MVPIGRRTSFMIKEKIAKASPSTTKGVKMADRGTPEALMTRISLSLAILDAAIRAPTRDPKGKDMAMMAGMANTTSCTTSVKAAFLDNMSSAMSKSWLMKNMMKKKRKHTRKEKKNSEAI
jgi:hypothetical protein